MYLKEINKYEILHLNTKPDPYMKVTRANTSCTPDATLSMLRILSFSPTPLQ